jgi:hypothetical protein
MNPYFNAVVDRCRQLRSYIGPTAANLITLSEAILEELLVMIRIAVATRKFGGVRQHWCKFNFTGLARFSSSSSEVKGNADSNIIIQRWFFKK